eukprot:2718353-Amphidinium_carterae.1
MIVEKRSELDLTLRRLQTGVNKIDEANAVVSGLQEDTSCMALAQLYAWKLLTWNHFGLSEKRGIQTLRSHGSRALATSVVDATNLEFHSRLESMNQQLATLQAKQAAQAAQTLVVPRAPVAAIDARVLGKPDNFDGSTQSWKDWCSERTFELCIQSCSDTWSVPRRGGCRRQCVLVQMRSLYQVPVCLDAPSAMHLEHEVHCTRESTDRS